MNRLPHWSITDKFPAFYDLESATSIEQTAKVYGAMNTLIDSYNEWIDKVNTSIEEFENSTDKNIELFATGLRQEFQDFIDTVELKLMSQDKEIKDAVDYMTKNLNNSVTTLLKEIRENGELTNDVLAAFKDIVDDINTEITNRQQSDSVLQANINNERAERLENEKVLNERMNTFTALDPGTTTGDAELMDARIDFKGVTHENVGEHIRSVAGQLSEEIADLNVASLQSFNTVITIDNYAELLPNLNDAPKNSIILIATGLASIENAPTDYSGGTVITYNPYTDYTGCIQLFIPSSGTNMLYRNRWSAWNNWQTLPRSADVTNLVSNVSSAQTDIGRIKREYSIGAMFSKVLFIGDSMTQGAYYGTPYISKIGKNFPNMFCRMGNIGGNNEGYSGINTIDWYANHKKDSYADWDLIILWLGTNDGLTDTLDTDVTPYNNYSDYANTNTGCYCKIIEDIYATNPSANIVMLNCFASSGNVDTTNSVLEEIADKYSLPLYSTSWLSIANNPSYSYHAGVNNPHLGVFGAWTLAQKLWQFISDYYTVNWIKLENGENANINPTNWTYINR